LPCIRQSSPIVAGLETRQASSETLAPRGTTTGSASRSSVRNSSTTSSAASSSPIRSSWER
jgi:hypothetical protein